MPRPGVKAVSLDDQEVSLLESLGERIGEGLGLKPLSVPDTIRFIRKYYEEHAIVGSKRAG